MINWLVYASSLSVLLPSIGAVLIWRYSSQEIRLLSFLFWFATIIELLNLLQINAGRDNIWIINIYSLIEGMLLLYLFGIWHLSKISKNAIWLALISYMLFWSYSTLDNIHQFNTGEKTFKGILLAIASGMFLLQFSFRENIILQQHYRFWFASAILFYFSLTVIVFTTANYILKNNIHAMKYGWQVHSYINIISNIMFANGFRCYYLKKSIYT